MLKDMRVGKIPVRWSSIGNLLLWMVVIGIVITILGYYLYQKVLRKCFSAITGKLYSKSSSLDQQDNERFQTSRTDVNTQHVGVPNSKTEEGLRHRSASNSKTPKLYSADDIDDQHTT